jgi:hypothetical protein
MQLQPAASNNPQLYARAASAKGRTKQAAQPHRSPRSVGSAEPARAADTADARLPPPPPLPDRYRGVALLPVQAFAVDDEQVRSFSQSFLEEIDALPGLQSISAQDMATALAAYQLQVTDCDRDTACLVRAGRYARAHWAVEVVLSGLGGTQSVALRLLDTQAAAGGQAELQRLSDTLADDPLARRQQIHRMAVALLDAAHSVGSLQVVCRDVGAEVYLDDVLLGTTPLPLQKELAAGLHILRVSKPGFSNINRFVDVVLQRVSSLTVDFTSTEVADVIVAQEAKDGFGAVYFVGGAPGTQVRLDAEPVGSLPLTEAIAQVAAGHRRLSLRQPGKPAQTFDLEVVADCRNEFILDTPREGAYAVVPAGTQPQLAPLPTLQQARLTVLQAARAERSREAWRRAAVPSSTFRQAVGLGAVTLGGLSFIATLVSGAVLLNDQMQANRIVDSQNSAVWSLAQQSASLKRLDELNRSGHQAERLQKLFAASSAGLTAAGIGFFIWEAAVTAPVAQPPPVGPGATAAQGALPDQRAVGWLPITGENLRLWPSFSLGQTHLTLQITW